MRARNVKPGLFTNELLGKADPLLTILFVGLWCAADREGRLKDRPLKLSAQIFPYRRMTEGRINSMLRWLHAQGFIVRYKVNDESYIQIVEFNTHQRPHSKEQDSKIPALSDVLPLPRTVQDTTLGHGEERSRQLQERSDSGFRIPDSGFRIPDTGHPAESSAPINDHERFEACLKSFPKYSGRKHLIMAEHSAVSLVSERIATWDMIEAGTKRYAEFVAATGRQVMSPANFYANDGDSPCLQEWQIPQQAQTPASSKGTRGDAVIDSWLKKQD